MKTSSKVLNLGNCKDKDTKDKNKEAERQNWYVDKSSWEMLSFN